jgi:hypothetical protein
MARVYGLIGLSLTNPVLFEHMARLYQLPDTAILVADSCRAVQQRLKDVMPAIRSGYWGRRLIERSVDIH